MTKGSPERRCAAGWSGRRRRLRVEVPQRREGNACEPGRQVLSKDPPKDKSIANLKS